MIVASDSDSMTRITIVQGLGRWGMILALIVFSITIGVFDGVSMAADSGSTTVGMVDLTHAIVVAPDSLSRREKKATAMLVDEVHKRTMVRWIVQTEIPKSPTTPVILVGPREKIRSQIISRKEFSPLIKQDGRPEGYQILSVPNDPLIAVMGHDERGVLFGVGRLLRELRMTRGRIEVPAGFTEDSAPMTALRGHQLGYRQKTNSYDAWDIVQWEQYYRDLAVFGTNAIELIPPRSDDEDDSPHFPAPPMEMMVDMSRVADDYGLDVWIWYPAMDKDYADAKTVEFARADVDVASKLQQRLGRRILPLHAD